ncbi:hypothetical protein V6Z11_A11G273100 [Gossypium hirsutum]|uniref:Uncharacterized protein n=2 Tax=Gossypium TaxID=3633 RepID=A0ABR0N629_GOSAR|nr:hypothetical protein PVK06_040656 [Gossypium arboreum]TYI02561.1 hypothetical protein ES332_A11G275400v1 [Gossypium tomentosum]
MARVREEETWNEAEQMSDESSLEELKRVLSESKAKAKVADDMANVVIKAVIDDDLNIDQRALVLIAKAAKALLAEVLNEVESGWSRLAAGGNGGGHQCSTTYHN